MDSLDQMSANVIENMLPELILDIPYFGVTDVTTIVVALTVFLALVIFFKVLQSVILIRLRSLANRTTTDIDNAFISAVEKIRPWVYNIVSLYIALQFFTLPTILDYAVTGLILFAVVWQAIEVLTTLVDFGTKRLIEKDEDGDGEIDPNAANASQLISLIARIVLWSLGFLFVLSNIGIQITSLIAGLGIGGVAVAFALQGVLSDLFASFSIYFDKPFRIGDFIIVGEDAGVVEHIGIKSTRLRTLQGEEMVVSNNELTTARVHNFKKMSERRIVSQFGIIYETPYEQVKAVPQVVKHIFDHLDGGRLDRIHFTGFGDSALMFEMVYYVETADFTVYLDIQQQFSFELMGEFAKRDIQFAYPTQTIYTKTVM